MALKIVIKFIIKCKKDKKHLMTAVAKIEGINSIKIDIEKATIEITGNVDPVCIVLSLRKKCGICVEIVSVGPEKPPDPKKKEPKCPKKCKPPCSKCPEPCHSKCKPPCTKCPEPCHSECNPPCHKCPDPCLSKCTPPPPQCPEQCSLDPCRLGHCDYNRNPCPFL
ncbi:hypothetical protein BT93_H1065 [Corymbia citriodora subsp. variegata]|nr:hypothetical protein BT93_H1065 [Corymbia citriodora subsp. variegata]